uniref:Uncharacterized protein n=1 Tax=Tetranychus urticae TaxID=32264 RepID=T1JUE5_TETUR
MFLPSSHPLTDEKVKQKIAHLIETPNGEGQ